MQLLDRGHHPYISTGFGENHFDAPVFRNRFLYGFMFVYMYVYYIWGFREATKGDAEEYCMQVYGEGLDGRPWK